MHDVNCPYCEAEQEICHDDGQGYAEDETHQQECSACGKTFVFNTSISFYYEPAKADCLNDADHIYEPTHTYPVEHSRMRCKMCDKERKCTDEEMESILIQRSR